MVPKFFISKFFFKKELTLVDWLMIMSGSSGGSLVASLNFFLVDFFMFMDENKGFFFFFQFCGFKSLVIFFLIF